MLWNRRTRIDAGSGATFDEMMEVSGRADCYSAFYAVIAPAIKQ
jgi:hypothetical protein